MSDINFNSALTIGGFAGSTPEEIERIRRVVYAYVDLIHGIKPVERAIAESQGENIKQLNPTTAKRLAEVTSRMEVMTTDGDTSQLTPDDIGDIYAWLLWAQGVSDVQS